MFLAVLAEAQGIGQVIFKSLLGSQKIILLATANRMAKSKVMVSLDCHSKISLTGWLHQQTFISYFWRLGSPRPRDKQIQFLARALFLACRWLPSYYVLTWPFFHACAWREREISLLIRSLISPRRVPPSLPNLNLIISQILHL